MVIGQNVESTWESPPSGGGSMYRRENCIELSVVFRGYWCAYDSMRCVCVCVCARVSACVHAHARVCGDYLCNMTI